MNETVNAVRGLTEKTSDKALPEKKLSLARKPLVKQCSLSNCTISPEDLSLLLLNLSE